MAKIIISEVKEFHNKNKAGFRKKADVIYVWEEGESVLENLMNRRSRPAKLYKKHVLIPGLKELGYTDQEMEVIVKNAHWSQRAGCNCGCSPGFLTQGMKKGEAHITFKAVLELHEVCPEGPIAD